MGLEGLVGMEGTVGLVVLQGMGQGIPVGLADLDRGFQGRGMGSQQDDEETLDSCPDLEVCTDHHLHLHRLRWEVAAVVVVGVHTCDET